MQPQASPRHIHGRCDVELVYRHGWRARSNLSHFGSVFVRTAHVPAAARCGVCPVAVVLVAASVSICGGIRTARAQAPQTDDNRRSPQSSPPAASPGNATSPSGTEQGSSLRWHPAWPRFRPLEWLATGVLAAGTLSLELAAPSPEEPVWEGGVMFDGIVWDGLRAHDERGRERAKLASDILMYGLELYPFVVDAGIVAAGIHRRPDIAAQMVAINAQSFALTSLVTTATKLLTRRERPEDRNCNPDERDCSTSSFFSGHTSLAFTGAGLVCAHHTSLDLYGSDAAGYATCGTALAAAATVGATRIVGDRHYATDVLAGAAMGLLSGYFLPKWLHYRSPPSMPEPSGGQPRDPSRDPKPSDLQSPSRTRADEVGKLDMVTPMAGPDRVGLQYLRTW